MKNIVEHIRRQLWALLLCALALNAHGQFQAAIGAAYPIDETSPGGIVSPSGDFWVLGTQSDPAIGISEWQLSRLNGAGGLISPSCKLSLMGMETASWIEHAVCDPQGNNRYIVAGQDADDMLLSAIDQNGNPIWTRRIGSPGTIEVSTCLKVDVAGGIILVGYQYSPTSGKYSITATRVDCATGALLWSRVFIHSQYHLVPMSVTTFAVTGSAQDNYYIAGKAVPTFTGSNEQVFMLQIGAVNPSFGFMKLYDVAPNFDDVANCIQGSLAPAPIGGIWLAGYSYNGNLTATDVLVMKTNLNGTPVWANNYDVDNGGAYVNHFELNNGQLVLTGRAEEYQAFQGTKAGHAMLMRMDGFGSSVDWTRIYTGHGFSSIGNRVNVTTQGEYVVTGNSLELLSPSQSASNILVVKTDMDGKTAPNCYHDTMTHIVPRMAVENGISAAALTLDQLANFVPVNLNKQQYNDPVAYCPAQPQPCDCNFTWTNDSDFCFKGFFTATCTPATTGVYTYVWDLDCNPNTPNITTTAANNDPNTTTFSHIFPHMFDCGGGTYQICVRITDPHGTVCTIMHTITVPNICCGTATGSMSCHASTPYKYDFVINVTPPAGTASCQYALSCPLPLSNVVYAGNTITGCVTVTDPVTLSVPFTLQSNCICASNGQPFTCTQQLALSTVCCKEICVDDQIICATADEAMISFYACNWPPVNNIHQVFWYAIPIPATGCPSSPWGGTPYQSTMVPNLQKPLLLFPDDLPSDVCVYAVIHLDDGPCTEITSNIAKVELCQPSGCTLNDQEYCYTGTPVLPGLISLTNTGLPPTCISTIEWFDENNNPVPPGQPITTYQPTTPLSLPPNFTDCYKDFFYTVVLSDICGTHTCKARVRLHNGDAKIGTLSVSPPPASMPLCWGDDATLKFSPECTDVPPGWAWYKKDCNGIVTILADAGLQNNCLNLNQLYGGCQYGVGALNGTCPLTEELTIEVLQQASLDDFTAVPDPCAEQYVVLTASVIPGKVLCSQAAFPCTYTYEWYKDGFLIGTTPGGGTSQTFTYFNPHPQPSSVAGLYYAIIREDCCPRNLLHTWPLYIEPACEQCIMGPCFICDNQPETFSVLMVQPPDKPCPNNCSFTWYQGVLDGNGNCVPGPVLGNASSISIGNAGQYFLESDCDGCIKLTKFDVLGCTSGQNFGQSECGVVTVENLMPKTESPLNVYPNPATGALTIEWSGNAPKNARVFVTDAMGRLLLRLNVPEGVPSVTEDISHLPSGLYFLKVHSADRLYNVAKLVKE